MPTITHNQVVLAKEEQRGGKREGGDGTSGVGLDVHEVGHVDAVDLAHAAHVVSDQVHDHEVLRKVLGVGLQVGLESCVFFGGAPARRGALDGLALHRTWGLP
jgi:hypothetical protein